ncbi:hypothetical protein HX017_15165 [Myroides marinus]|uniref:Lipoprotein n=1 Tax=Myroides marinus TaxID=703342 RepID=A0A165RXY6_9FLAO|nr:hypothetical protein [Myroides marinus]KUF44059.1 hypothetical protein AS361_06235 [Myroides marinus]KZE79780.1 hypothetical protein AV926_11415 [Myroides marinus]MDM1348481.1 hypothetical protein [Myroides marinus]MDM1351960.1 hypothetical protein [Myroides marinus]MDM1355535.1 hypothetical protein [Myroides marinus]
MNRVVKFLGVLVLGLSLFSCKDEKNTTDGEGETIENVTPEEVPVESIDGGDLKTTEGIAPWENLYEQEPTILKNTTKILKVDQKKAVELMSEANKVEVSKDGLETVIAALKTTAAKDYLSDEFNKAIIENGGKGVGLRVDVSPNASEDGSDKRGNYYQFTVYENYEDRIVTVGTFIFDIRTLSFYEMDVVEADYVPLKYAVAKKKELAAIIKN